jgi:hypothetical protein
LYTNIYYIDPSAIFNGSRFISATNGVCKFADSFNIYQTSVKKIGKLLGIVKPELGDEYYVESIDEGVVNRCSEDCRIVYEALIEIFEMAGAIKITQASLSMEYFRRHHQKHIIEHNELNEEFWQSYYGGRCEMFFKGQTHCMVYDINSSYPRAMQDCVFPNPKFLKDEYRVSLKKFNNLLRNFEGLVYCDVEHKRNWAGFLPVKRKGKLYFPIGNFSGCWNFNELRFAIDSGFVRVKAIKKVVYSERFESPFTDYIIELYKQRLATSDDFEKYRIKIFMNSLYGKFAQKIETETIYIEDIELQYPVIELHMKQHTFIKINRFNSKRKDAILTVKAVKMMNLNYAIPSFSSYITSYGRIELMKGMMMHPEGVVNYVDTDSKFITTDLGLTSSMELGAWKKEGEVNDKTLQWEPKIITELRGLKNYVYIEPKTGKIKDRCKGVPESAIKTGEKSYEYFNLMKTKESLRRGMDIQVVRRTKVISGDYEKRILMVDGTTKPIIL